MKISIITATFNSANSIESAIHSVNIQNYDNIEHIFVDGGSTDSTLQLIDSLSNTEKVVISEPDKGIYDAINKGIELASGDIIGLLHSDDFLAGPSIIQNIMDLFSKLDVDGVYGDLQYVSKENQNKIIRYWKSKDFQPRLLKFGWMPPHPTLYLKKDVFEKFGKYTLEYKIAADYDFLLRIMQQPNLKFNYIPMVICKMRIGGVSNKNFKNIYQKSYEDYLALKENRVKWPYQVLFFKNLSKITQFIIRN